MTSNILKAFNKPLTFEKMHQLLKNCPEYIRDDFSRANDEMLTRAFRQKHIRTTPVEHRIHVLKEEPKTALINSLMSGGTDHGAQQLDLDDIQTYEVSYWFIIDQLPMKMDALLLMSGSPESMVAPLIALPVRDTGLWLPAQIENLQFVGPRDGFGFHRNLTSDPQLLLYINHILKT